MERTPAASVQNVTLSSQDGDGANFGELLGKKGLTKLDNVFHAASFEIDQSGGEGGATTPAVAVAKSFPVPTTQSEIDRPFDFALTYRMTGTPLFEGVSQTRRFPRLGQDSAGGTLSPIHARNDHEQNIGPWPL